MIHRLSKVAAAKMFSPVCILLDTTCFDKCFLFHVIAVKRYSFYYFEIFSAAILLHSFKQVF